MSEDCPHCVFEKTEANCRGCFEGSHYKPKPITNADRLRAMSDEELAELWWELVDCGECPVHKDCKMTGQDCKKLTLDWLKQEVNDDP